MKHPIFALIALCLTLVPAAQAQFASGVEATVLDPTGAAIPRAEITITNVATGVTQSAVADDSGFVRVLQLQAGDYNIEVKAGGFRSWKAAGVHIEGHDVRTVYPKMVLGETSTSVDVVADAQQIETTKGNIGRTLEQETVKESPMVGQNVYATVATLAPGVTGLGDASGNIAAAGSVGTNSFNAEAGFQINAAGQRQETNEYQIDGTPVNGNSRDGVVNITPQPETIQEMKVSASTFSAEKGRQSGALIELFTKPGANKFHGMLSEFHTDGQMTSRTVFQTKVPKYIRNDFGGTLGGPIWKDKTFFFGSLFWMRSIQGATLQRVVETKEFRDYVSTNYPNSLAAQFLTKGAPGAYPTTNILTAAQVKNTYKSQFASPAIPDTLPVMGTAFIDITPIGNGFQGHLRLDHNINDKNKVFFSYFRNTTEGQSADGRPQYSYTNPNGTMYAKVDYVHVFGANLVNDAGISFTRNTGNQSDRIPNLPNIYSISGITNTFSQWGPSSWTQNNFIYQDNLTWTVKNHSVHIGLDVDRQQDLNDFTNGLVRPYFYFFNMLDFANDRPYYQSGPVLDLSTKQVANNLYQRIYMLYVAPYVQDDWKVNRRLTLNFGVRLDYFGHLTTVQNGRKPIAFFTPQGTGSFATQVTNGSMATRGANGAATTNAQYRFAPRVGFAWDVFGDGKTSLHGGYGIFSNKIGEYAYVNNMRTNLPDYANPALDYRNGTPVTSFSYGASSSGAQGFAPPPGINFTLDSHGGIVGTRTTVGGIDPNLAPPMVHSWAVGLQRAIGSFVVEADYLATASRKLYLQTNVNRFAGDYLDGTLSYLNSSFGTVTYGRNAGIGNSHVGAFGISKSFSRGLTTHVTYTYGKSLDYTSSNDNGVSGGQTVFDAQNPERQYARSDYDARHRLSADMVWHIPGAKSGVMKAVTSGFTLSPVVILQSGRPFNVYTSANYTAGGDYNADGYNYDVPNAPVSGVGLSVKRSDYLKGIFPDKTIFTKPATATEGTLGRNVYQGPGFASTNIAIQRSIPLPFLGEAGKFELRGEFLNAFNRVNLGQPTGDMNNSNFGKSTSQLMPRQIQLVGHIRF